MKKPNKITSPNAGGPRQLAIPTPLTARVGQFWTLGGIRTSLWIPALQLRQFMSMWTWMTRWFAARAASASRCLRSFSTFASYTLREQFCIAGVQAVLSMRGGVQRSSVLPSASQRFFLSPTSSSMTRARLSGRAVCWFIRRVAVAAHSMITEASWVDHAA